MNKICVLGAAGFIGSHLCEKLLSDYKVVGIGSDNSILKYKGRLPVCLEDERLFMLREIKCVKEAWVNTGEGGLDFAEDLEHTAPDILIVNEDQHTEEKELLCQDLGIAYYVLKRTQEPGLPARSTTQLRKL